MRGFYWTALAGATAIRTRVVPRSVGSDGRRVVEEKVAGAPGGVVGVSDLSRRRTWVEVVNRIGAAGDGTADTGLDPLTAAALSRAAADTVVGEQAPDTLTATALTGATAATSTCHHLPELHAASTTAAVAAAASTHLAVASATVACIAATAVAVAVEHVVDAVRPRPRYSSHTCRCRSHRLRSTGDCSHSRQRPSPAERRPPAEWRVVGPRRSESCGTVVGSGRS